MIYYKFDAMFFKALNVNEQFVIYGILYVADTDKTKFVGWDDHLISKEDFEKTKKLLSLL